MRRVSSDYLIINLIWFILGIVNLGLVLRFFFRLFGANSNAPIVEFIYESTAPLLDPFRGIFREVVVDPGNVLEFTTLFAILVYTILAWLLVEFIAFVLYQGRTHYRA